MWSAYIMILVYGPIAYYFDDLRSWIAFVVAISTVGWVWLSLKMIRDLPRRPEEQER